MNYTAIMVSKLHFNIEELQELLTDPCSLVRVKRSIRHIAVHPSNLGDLKTCIKRMLDQLLHKFDSSFGGFLLGYEHVKVPTENGTILNDYSHIHFNIDADFYIFTPEVDCVLYGITNKKSRDHIGCLVHNVFNVTILRPDAESRKKWLGASVEIGDKVKFLLTMCDFTGNLPYMQGTLISSSPAKENAEPQSPKKKKSKKVDSSQEDDNIILPKVNFGELDQEKKRKWESEDKIDNNKKRKKKRHKEDDDEGDPERSTSLHMSAEDPDYGEVIQHIKESYLGKNLETKKLNEGMEKNKKQKLYSDIELNKTADIEKNANEVGMSEHVKRKEKKRKRRHENDDSEDGSKKKKKKKKQKHENKTETVIPKFEALWNVYRKRSQDLAERFSSSSNNSNSAMPSGSKEDKEIEKRIPDIQKLLSSTESLEKDETIITPNTKKKETDKRSSSGSTKKRKTKDGDSGVDVSPIKIKISDQIRSQDSPRKYATTIGSPLKESVPSQSSVTDDHFGMKTQHVVEDIEKVKELAHVNGDSEDSGEENNKVNDSAIITISKNSPFHKLAASMANSEDRKHSKLSKSSNLSGRQSLPLLSHTSLDDMLQFGTPVTPFNPIVTSTVSKSRSKSQSKEIKKQKDSPAEKLEILKMNPAQSATQDVNVKPTFATPSKKSRKQKDSLAGKPEILNINKDASKKSAKAHSKKSSKADVSMSYEIKMPSSGSVNKEIQSSNEASMNKEQKKEVKGGKVKKNKKKETDENRKIKKKEKKHQGKADWKKVSKDLLKKYLKDNTP